MRIATEEEPEDYGSVPQKNEAAAELGWNGAAALAANMILEQRVEIARKAAARRRGNEKNW